jgi:hypothetical protein
LPQQKENTKRQPLDAISVLNKAATMYMRNPDPLTKTKFVSARKHVKRVVKEAKNRWMQTKLEEIENYKDQPRNRWKIVDGYTGHHSKPKVIKMKKTNGSLASNSFQEFNRNEESSYEDSIFNEIDPIPCEPKKS